MKPYPKTTLILFIAVWFTIVFGSTVKCQDSFIRQDRIAHMVACNTVAKGFGVWPAIGIGVGVEVWDSTKNGGKFCVADMIANVSGAIIGSLKIDEYFALKFSFRNISEYVHSESFEQYFFRLSPHYDYMVFWAVLKGKHFIDKPFSFINICVGITTNGYADEHLPVKREILFGIDIDIKSIFPDIPRVFNCFHIGITLN